MHYDHLIAELCQATAPAGREEAARLLVQTALEQLEPMKQEQDPLGSLIAYTQSDASDSPEAGKQSNCDLLLAAALDEPPFLVTHVDESGFLRFHSPLP